MTSKIIYLLIAEFDDGRLPAIVEADSESRSLKAWAKSKLWKELYPEATLRVIEYTIDLYELQRLAVTLDR